MGGEVVAPVGGEARVAEAAQVRHDDLEPGRGERARRCATRCAWSPASRGRAAAGSRPSPSRQNASSTPSRTVARRTANDAPGTRGSLGNLRPPMAEHRYDPQEIEPRWQERVGARAHLGGVQRAPTARAASSYVLEMLPYPSGEPHIGHLKFYSVGDAVAHFHRRIGRRVLHPMGYDAFGLPAENHAIKTGVHPRDSTDDVDRLLPAPVPRVGDLDRLVARVRHPRAALLPLDAVDLPQALRARAWPTARRRRSSGARTTRPCSPTSRSIDGRCERCGAVVEVRQLEQWFLRITDYADRLLDDLDTIDWPEHVKTMQRNWIGRSEGAEVVFRCEELGIDYPVFTTRPDTLFGATFFVMAPEHPDVLRLAAGTPSTRQASREYVNRALTETSEERGDDRPAEDRRAARPHGDQPGQRRADPDVRRRLRADGVRDRRDHGGPGPRRARLRLRRGVRPADPPGRRRRRGAALRG